MHPEFSTESYTPDRLLYNTDGLRTGEETVAGSQGTLARGTVVARDSDDSARLVPVDSASAIESVREPVAILAAGIDTSGGPKRAPLYYAGEFNASEVIFSGSDSAETHRDGMRQRGLFLREGVPA